MPHLFRSFNHAGRAADPPKPLSRRPPSFAQPCDNRQEQKQMLEHVKTAGKGQVKKDFEMNLQVTFQLLFWRSETAGPS
jgi:hypothetical protein